MKLIDYTGKLNNHNDYIDLLNKISVKCEYIEVVILDKKESNELVDKFKEDIIDVRKVKEWWGTELACSEPCNYLYRLKFNKKYFHIYQILKLFVNILNLELLAKV